jgi:histidine ammonia-lyase
MAANTANVVAIELLAAAQGIEYHRPLTSSRPLEAALRILRRAVPRYDHDRFFAPDIEAAAALVSSGRLGELAQV